MTNNRGYDVVLFGATGYTGRLVAHELVKRARGARLAFAGRNAAKLQQLCDELGQPALPVIVGDSDDASFLTNLARNTAVVCTTVGPYAKVWSQRVRRRARRIATSRARSPGCAA
jgi:short subunit dehydrogenase-like uncharacterized protein